MNKSLSFRHKQPPNIFPLKFKLTFIFQKSKRFTYIFSLVKVLFIDEYINGNVQSNEKDFHI